MIELETFKREIENWNKLTAIHEFNVAEILQVIDRAITAEAKYKSEFERALELENQLKICNQLYRDNFELCVDIKEKLETAEKAIEIIKNYVSDCDECIVFDYCDAVGDDDKRSCLQTFIDGVIEKGRD